jgi:biotin carboxyl carrier protein
MRFVVVAGGAAVQVEVAPAGPDRFRVRLGEEALEVDARAPGGGPWSLLIEGVSYLADVRDDGGDLLVTVSGETHRLRVERTGRAGRPGAPGGAGPGGERLVAPMPGRVVAVHVAPGQAVAPGAPLVVLEAMKMENEFRASDGGTVREVRVAPGQAVNAGDLLVVIEPADPPPPGPAPDDPGA